MNFIAVWKNWIRPLAIFVYFILMMIAIPLCIIELTNDNSDKKHKDLHVKAWFSGGVFVMIAVPISLWEIINHVINYTQPHLQKYIIRIIWMVPIYALNAWFALRFKGAAIYLDTLRECYEAYVIYNFMAYLLNYLWTTHPQLDLVLRRKQQQKHIIPFCCLPFWPMGSDIIQNCKHGVLQYTVIRPVTTIIALICELNGKYDEGDFNFKSAWSYLVIINNISQIWAMYCLILFYKATKDMLAPIRPIPKFLCVKFVVFFSFWQAVLIAAMAKLNMFPESDFYDNNVKDESAALQDFCICIEMLIAAIAHYFSFSHKPFIDADAPEANCCISFWSMWDIRDVKDDVVEHVKVIGSTMKKTMSTTFSSRPNNAETTPLLQDSSSTANVNTQMTQADIHQNGYQSQPDVDWEVTSVDRWNTQPHVAKSTTPSMHNYLDISGSMDNQSVQSQVIEHSNDTDKERKKYKHLGDSDSKSEEPLSDSDSKTETDQGNSGLNQSSSGTLVENENKPLIDFGSNDNVNQAGEGNTRTDADEASDNKTKHQNVNNQTDDEVVKTTEENADNSITRSDGSGNAVC